MWHFPFQWDVLCPVGALATSLPRNSVREALHSGPTLLQWTATGGDFSLPNGWEGAYGNRGLRSADGV